MSGTTEAKLLPAYKSAAENYGLREEREQQYFINQVKAGHGPRLPQAQSTRDTVHHPGFGSLDRILADHSPWITTPTHRPGYRLTCIYRRM